MAAKKAITEAGKKMVESALRRSEFLNMMNAINSLKQFAVGDIVTVKKNNDDDEFEHSYYEYEGHETDIKERSKVVYIDSKGFPCCRVIDRDGDLEDEIWNVPDFLEEYIEYYGMDNGYNINFKNLIEHDSDFINSAILEDNTFDPLHEFKEKIEEMNASNRTNVENWYKLHEHNKSLKIPTSTERYREKFYKKLTDKSTFWVDGVGKISLKMKDKNIAVFKSNDGMWALNISDLGDFTFYSKKPKDLPYISESDKIKYKPKTK